MQFKYLHAFDKNSFAPGSRHTLDDCWENILFVISTVSDFPRNRKQLAMTVDIQPENRQLFIIASMHTKLSNLLKVNNSHSESLRVIK